MSFYSLADIIPFTRILDCRQRRPRITTEALICEFPEKKDAPTPGGGGMGGMF